MFKYLFAGVLLALMSGTVQAQSAFAPTSASQVTMTLITCHVDSSGGTEVWVTYKSNTGLYSDPYIAAYYASTVTPPAPAAVAASPCDPVEQPPTPPAGPAGPAFYDSEPTEFPPTPPAGPTGPAFVPGFLYPIANNSAYPDYDVIAASTGYSGLKLSNFALPPWLD